MPPVAYFEEHEYVEDAQSVLTQEQEDLLLDQIRRQYLQLLHPTTIDLSALPSNHLRLSSFQHRLYAEIFDPDLHQWLPPARYTARVVKRFITKIEEAAFAEGYGCPEIDEDLISFYAMIMAQVPTQTPPKHKNNATYIITPPLTNVQSPQTIRLVECRSLISGDGHTGSRTWEAACALGELLISSHYTIANTSTISNDPDFFELDLTGKNVLELGAGTGFLSMLSAKLGAKQVVATDGSWQVCSSLRGNVTENGLEEIVKVGRLLWGNGKIEESEDADNETSALNTFVPDVVLASDVTYDTAVIPDLVKELHSILTVKNPKAEVLVAATVRSGATFDRFREELVVQSLASKFEQWIAHGPRILFYDNSTGIQIARITLATDTSNNIPSGSAPRVY